MVFQGAQNAFNPVLKIRNQFEDTEQSYGWTDRAAVRERALSLVHLARLEPSARTTPISMKSAAT